MSPTEIHNPADLFGEVAVRDLRQLKRAYAGLIKAHGPETDPRAFEHIRRMFEAVKAALERESVAEPEPWPQASGSDGDLVEARIRKARADDLDSLAAWLESTTLSEACEPAAVARLALCEAVSPRVSLEWLMRLADHEKLRPVALALAHFLLQARPHQSRSPDWPRLLASFDDTQQCGLVAHRVCALLAKEDAEAAEELFRTHGGALRRVTPGAWLTVVRELLDAAGCALTEAELIGIRTELDAADLEIEPALHALLQWRVDVRLALLAAASDAEVPGYLVETLQRGLGADLPTRAHLLIPLAAQAGFYTARARLAHFHPTLHKFLDDLRESLSGANAFLSRWLVEEAAPPLPVELPESGVERLLLAIDAVDEPGLGYGRPPPPGVVRVAACFERVFHAQVGVLFALAIVASVTGLGKWALEHGGVALCTLGLIVFGPMAARRPILAWAERKAAEYHAIVAGSALQQLKAWLRSSGFYPHEVAAFARAHDHRRLLKLATDLLWDDDCDFQVLGPAHLERALRVAVASQAATAAAAPEEPEP